MNHTILGNPPSVMYQKKYVSIHSEDRDISKYPNSAEFDIEVPEDITNVSSMRLVNWAFPSNYNTFSELNSNVTLTFKLTSVFNPTGLVSDGSIEKAIFSCLDASKNDYVYSIKIEDGFYNPDQIALVLTNKMNESVTIRIRNSLSGSLLTQFDASGGYTNFRVVYNKISSKIWFGNVMDGFSLLNNDVSMKPRSKLPDSINWGLPNNLGFAKGETKSITKTGYTPRFYYGDVLNVGDNGYWLMPPPAPSIYKDGSCNYIEAPNKINIMGPSYFYMELDGHNCIDETSPFYFNYYTGHTNDTNGRVNSSFAKIAIPSTPLTQFFDRDSAPVKIYSPPLERIRKLKIRLRYHDGEVVNFGLFDYSFMLEVDVVQPITINKNLRHY